MNSLNKRLLALVINSSILLPAAYAQDPKLPSANFGLNNMHSGKSRPPGWSYTQYIQTYQSKSEKDFNGETIDGKAGQSSILGLQQLTFISDRNILSGHLGFALFTILSKSNPSGPLSQDIRINPSPFGDIIAGTFIQWYDKKVLGMPFFHRLGLLSGIPVGSFDRTYSVNPSSHRFRLIPNYQFSITPLEGLSISIKNNLYFFFNEIGTTSRPGFAYNLNYAVEITLFKKLILEGAGYYLTQLSEDSNNGNHQYYQQLYGLNTTKERVFAAGPGLGYSTNTGLSFEFKTMWESAAKNRPQGVRNTFVVSYKL